MEPREATTAGAGPQRLPLSRCIVQEDPFNAETPLAALAGPLVPTGICFVRSHFDVPALDGGAYRLRVTGAVSRELQLSLDDLRRLPSRELVVTMECAGNGRTLMRPPPPGVPWGLGAVSTVRFEGTALVHVLEMAGLDTDAMEVLFVGADRGQVQPGRWEPFARSLPVPHALHPDTLLAWGMNGAPLPPEHGFPLRLVVPRWYGMASVKWLVEIRALRAPFDGYFQAEQYRYVDDATGDARPVSLMRVRALIASPADGETVPLGPVEVRGMAWSGHGPIERVEVSADGGSTWQAAELGQPLSPYSATPWRVLWRPDRPGTYTLVARATDAAGNVQPLDPVWNRLGYGNNCAQRVCVVVRG